MNLIRVFFISVYLFLHNNASDIQKIQISGPKPIFGSHVVQLNEPFEINFENFTVVSRCTYDHYGNINSNFFIYFKSGFVTINIPKATPEMSTRWQCEFFDMNNQSYNYTFDVRVKGAKLVNVKLGGVHELFNSTNSSVLAYDGISEQTFEEGELIDLTCGNFYGSGNVRLRYYDAHGKMMTNTQDVAINYHLNFRMLVTDKSVNGSFVDCTYITSEIHQEFTYRTIFLIANESAKSSNNDFLVTVNNIVLTALPRKVHGKDRFIYYYIKGESLKLTCKMKNQLLHGDIQGKITHENSRKVITKDITNTSLIYSTSIETTNLNGIIFQCYSKAEQLKSAVDIMFFEEQNNDPVIRGLSSSNILYQYNSSNEWVTYYQHNDNQVLKLTCITPINRQPQWRYKSNITSTIHENTKSKTKYISYEFGNIKSNETIICESTKIGAATKKMKIVILKAEGVRLIAYEIIYIVAVLLAVTAIGVLTFRWYKSKRNKVLNEQGSIKSLRDDDILITELTNQKEVNLTGKHQD